MSNVAITTRESRSGWAPTGLSVWTRAYLRQTFLTDIATSFVVSTAAIGLRFDGHITYQYAGLSLAFPALWVVVLRLAGAYDQRFVGTGSDEFRKVINAGVSLTAALAIFSYLMDIELSRFYLLVSMPCVTVLALVGRYVKRKRLHRKRARGECMSGVVAVGYPAAVADLVSELRRDSYHGLSVVATCIAGTGPGADEVAIVPTLAVGTSAGSGR